MAECIIALVWTIWAILLYRIVTWEIPNNLVISIPQSTMTIIRSMLEIKEHNSF